MSRDVSGERTIMWRKPTPERLRALRPPDRSPVLRALSDETIEDIARTVDLTAVQMELTRQAPALIARICATGDVKTIRDVHYLLHALAPGRAYLRWSISREEPDSG